MAQADGQMEQVNQELEQYLWLFVSERQDDWVDLLPMAEFQYNNHIHSSTQQTPFFLDSGQHPRMGFEPQQPSRLESVNEFTDRMKLALEEAKLALAKAKDDMARYYNQRRLPTPVYKLGDLVYLDASDIKTTQPSRKLSRRRLGPFPVERQVSRNAYRLQLPFPMRRLHPVFNVVKLTALMPLTHFSELASGSNKTHVPYTDLAERTSLLVDPKYLLSGFDFKFKDPRNRQRKPWPCFFLML